MPKSMQQLTAAKNGDVLQELRNLIINMKQNGREIGAGMEEFLDYMDGLNLHNRQANQSTKIMQCIKCNAAMDLYPVNNTPKNQVGGDYKSQWFCNHCGNSIFSVKSPQEEWKMLKEK